MAIRAPDGANNMLDFQDHLPLKFTTTWWKKTFKIVSRQAVSQRVKYSSSSSILLGHCVDSPHMFCKSDHSLLFLRRRLALLSWDLHKAGGEVITCKIIPIPYRNYRDRILRCWRRNFLPDQNFCTHGGCAKLGRGRLILFSSDLVANCWASSLQSWKPLE